MSYFVIKYKSMTPDEFPKPVSEESPADPARSVLQTIAEYKSLAEAAHAMRSEADPRSRTKRAEEYLEQHPQQCKAVFELLWVEYIKQELASTHNGKRRTIASIKRMDKSPDSPSGEAFDLINSDLSCIEKPSAMGGSFFLR